MADETEDEKARCELRQPGPSGTLHRVLETLGNLGDFVGGIAVVITLVYLVVQIRQNTNATRVSTLQSIMGIAQQLNAGVAAPRLPQIFAKLRRGERLEDEEVVAYRYHIQGALTNQWQVFYQHRQGMVEDEILAAYERRNSIFWSQRLFRSVWPEMRVGYPPDFQSYMERLIELVPEEDGAASGFAPLRNHSATTLDT